MDNEVEELTADQGALYEHLRRAGLKPHIAREAVTEVPINWAQAAAFNLQRYEIKRLQEQHERWRRYFIGLMGALYGFLAGMAVTHRLMSGHWW